MNTEPLVYIIILNYNGYTDTINCVENIKNINYKNYKIVIIDNASTDESITILKNKFRDCYIIQSDINNGYAGGNNLGIKFAINNNSDYICILNNDVLVDKNFLRILIEYYLNNTNIGMIGPMILDYYDQKVVQSTGAMVNLYKGNINIINKNEKLNNIEKKIINCDYVGGACILIKTKVISEIGLIPEEYFLFFEETEWCIKAKKLGYKIICNCNSKVMHKGSSSINKVTGLSEYYMARNRILFEKRNASKNQLFLFYFYFLLCTIYKLLTHKEKLYKLNYYFDGIFNKVNKKFRLIDLNK